MLKDDIQELKAFVPRSRFVTGLTCLLNLSTRTVRRPPLLRWKTSPLF